MAGVEGCRGYVCGGAHWPQSQGQVEVWTVRWRDWPVMDNQRQANGCHHGNCGRNCGGRPHASQNCKGNVMWWK